MRKAGKISGIVILLLAAAFFAGTSRVDHTPYYETGYFKNTIARLDSLRQNMVVTNGPLEAGFSRVSITPCLNHHEDNWEKGRFRHVPLAGYGARKGAPATGIHDSIFVMALALKSQDNLLVFVTADLLLISPNLTDTLMILLADDGLRRDQLFLSATHTHSAPGGWGTGIIGSQFAGKNNPGIEKWLVKQIRKAIVMAIDDLKPAEIGSGHFDAGSFTRNRLTGDLGTTNDDFNFIVVNQFGHNKAIVGSFAGHTTTLGAGNMEISADYPGYWARKTGQLASGMAMFFAGPMGSQRPYGEGREFERARSIGEALADSTLIHHQSVAMKDSVILTPLSLRIELPPYRMRLTPKISLSSFISRKLMPYPRNVYIQAVRIDNLIWITVPAELSGELALQIRNSLSAHGYDGMITSFNGSYIGYIIPGKYFYMDEYEPKTMGWFGPYLGDYTMDLIRYLYTTLISL